MTSKKSRVLMSLGTTVLVLSLITSSMVGGTFAKYTSTVAGNDSARVAKFDFDVKSGSIALTKENATIDLFNTVYDSGVFGTDPNNKNGDDKLVAPGVEGKFGLVVTNRSEVAVKATLTITETAADGTSPNTVPIIYAYTDGSKKTTFWSNVITDKNTPILLHEAATGSDVQTMAGSAVAVLANEAALTAAKNGQSMVKISGNLEELAAEINKDPGAKLEPHDGTADAAPTMNLGESFKWFWAYEIYTSEAKADNSGNEWVPTKRDDADTAMVWESNAAKTVVPGIKVKLDVNITQMDTYTAPTA